VQRAQPFSSTQSISKFASRVYQSIHPFGPFLIVLPFARSWTEVGIETVAKACQWPALPLPKRATILLLLVALGRAESVRRVMIVPLGYC